MYDSVPNALEQTIYTYLPYQFYDMVRSNLLGEMSYQTDPKRAKSR